jgi:serine/threonine protein kinase/Tfp pilus assembly protein PilF
MAQQPAGVAPPEPSRLDPSGLPPDPGACPPDRPESRRDPPHDSLQPVHAALPALDVPEDELQATIRLTEVAATAPEVGTEFLGFRLVAELGRGAFGRVYLALQETLANRQVVLKVSADMAGEAATLAQLLHTNVVPVYSIHDAAPLQAVCMPYLGRTTLADILKDITGRAAPPDSGKILVSTLHSANRGSRIEDRGSKEEAAELALPSARDPQSSILDPRSSVTLGAGEVGSTILLEKLAGLSYVEAILWLASRLADGLAHAHERGILHRDLKPANILLTDEGQPMLLDFNLAEDTKRRTSASAALLGGTLPYMAPEQLRGFQGDSRPLDGRSDLYALGVILYELLTGRHPFPVHSGPARDVLADMVGDRQAAPPRLRGWNRAVTPAIESIIRRCLEPEPDCRYQSARELQEDLQRHLESLPLRYAREPSLRERARKWTHRHPRLASLGSMGLLAAALLLGLAGLFVYHNHRVGRFEALAALGEFRESARAVQFLLTGRAADRAQLSDTLARGRHALERYGTLNDASWLDRPQARNLPAAEREQLRQEAGVLLLTLARAHALQAAGRADPQRRTEDLRSAVTLNERAAACYGEDGSPRALWAQRADLLAALGSADEAEALRARAAGTPLRDARDCCLTARELVVQGRFRAALPLLEEAARLDPRDVQTWFLLAGCHDGLGRDAEAAACYTTCIALWPHGDRLHFNRGLAHLRRRDYRQALADFDRVVALCPDLADAYFNRALAHHGLDRQEEALADLDRALARNAPYTRAYFLRARIRDKLGDAAGAERDRAEGLRREPDDDLSWNARGLARLKADPAGALADFQRALEFNPRSRAALDNQAHVLAEVLGRTEDAVAVLDRALALYPDHVTARASRAVLLARLGDRGAAHKDAAEALRQDGGPAVLYQVAGVYALTSRQEPADRREALRLLGAALRQGYGLDLLARDPDLHPLQGGTDFRQLVEAAQSLRAGP